MVSLAALGLALAVALFVLTGPGFPWVLRTGASAYAASQGLEGDLQVEGSFWRGFAISDLAFEAKESADLPLRRVALNSLRVDYRARDLILRAAALDWLDAVALRGLSLELELPEPSAGSAEGNKPRDRRATPVSAFSPLWALLGAELDLREIELDLRQGERRWQVDGLELRYGEHDAEGETLASGILRVASLSLPDAEEPITISTGIRREARQLVFEDVRIGERDELSSLAITEASPGDWEARGRIELGGGSVQFAAATSGSVLLEMPRGSVIDLGGIPTGEGDPILSGTVSDLHLAMEGDFTAPSTWETQGRLVASGLRWGGLEIETVALMLRENRLALELRSPDFRLEGRARLRLDEVVPMMQADGGEAPDWRAFAIDAEADLEIGSLASLIDGLVEAGAEDGVEWQAPLGELLEGGLAAKLEGFRWQGGMAKAGRLEARGEGLAWDGVAFGGIELAAEFAATIQAGLRATVDAASQLEAAARIDQESRTFEAEARALFGLDPGSGALAEFAERYAGAGIAGEGGLEWRASGSFDEPAIEGEGEFSFKQLRYRGGLPFDFVGEIAHGPDGFALPSVSLRSEALWLGGAVRAADGRLRLEDWRLEQGGKSRLSLEAALPLGTRGAEGPPDEAEARALSLRLEIDGLELGSLLAHAMPEPPLHGGLSGQARIDGQLDAAEAEAQLVFRPGDALAAGLSGEEAAFTLDLSLAGAPAVPETWQGGIEALLDGLHWGEQELGAVALSVEAGPEGAGGATAGVRRLLASLVAEQSGARLEARGRIGLDGAENVAALAQRPISLDAALAVPELEALWSQFAPEAWRAVPLAGQLDLSVEGGRLESGELLAGVARLSGESLAVEGVPLALLEAEAEVIDPGLVSGQWRIEADEHSSFAGHGRYGIGRDDYGAEASLRLDLATEGAMRRLLGSREIARLLPRRAEAELAIAAEPDSPGPRGALSLKAADLSLAEGAVPIRSAEAGIEFAEGAVGGGIELRSGLLDIDAEFSWDGQRLELARLAGRESGVPRLEGSASVPLAREALSPQAWFAQEEPVSVRLKADAFPLRSIFGLLKAEAPVTGDLTLDLSLAGSPAAPELGLELALADLASPTLDQVPPAQVAISVATKGETATLSGGLRHPDVNPLELSAEFPFHPGAWARGERDPLEEAVRAEAKMARSPLAFLATRVPEIQSIEGAIALDATLGGTLRQPALAGDGTLEVSRLRLADRNAPSIYDIDLRAAFRDDRVTLERLRAIVAGGEIEASGSLVLRAGEDPAIDLRATGREVLIYRTPDLSLRTDADLTLLGPWPRARLGGSVGITNSGFYKVFDLLPQAIPMRRASALPTVERAPRGGGAPVADLDLGVEIEPFRDWEVDLRIHTKEPFSVRSNLVTSDLVADLHIGGTLGRPVPRGHLAIDEGELDLPFSSIDVEVGRVEFDEQTGFDGAIEFKALAKADQYRINVFLYNRVLDPKFVLTSVPPLPQEDLLSLIVTGSTRSEMLGADAGAVAASRAATLLMRNLTRARDAADRDPSLFDHLQERTELDIGGINAETGAETVGGRIRLWKQLFLVGNVDTESDYRAVLKYVFRFR